jgi:hypothetical protein
MEAEDEFSAIFLIGPNGRKVEAYNARDFQSWEGQMNVAVGPEFAVAIADLGSKVPSSDPAGRVEVVKDPGVGGFWPFNYERTFHNEISSVRFG